MIGLLVYYPAFLDLFLNVFELLHKSADLNPPKILALVHVDSSAALIKSKELH